MKIICIGRNYVDHAKELNNPVPEFPLVFMKPSTALIRNGSDLYYPDFTKDLHHELEIVLKISKNGKHIDKQFAQNYFDEITLGLDFTARDIQNKCKENGHPWEIAKAFDQSAFIGKFISKRNLDLKKINFHLLKNGNETQRGNSGDLIFDFEYIIHYISQYFTLQKGDLIFTGTPQGVGPVSIGDKLEGFIDQEVICECNIK